MNNPHTLNGTSMFSTPHLERNQTKTPQGELSPAFSSRICWGPKNGASSPFGVFTSSFQKMLRAPFGPMFLMSIMMSSFSVADRLGAVCMPAMTSLGPAIAYERTGSARWTGAFPGCCFQIIPAAVAIRVATPSAMFVQCGAGLLLLVPALGLPSSSGIASESITDSLDVQNQRATDAGGICDLILIVCISRAYRPPQLVAKRGKLLKYLVLSCAGVLRKCQIIQNAQAALLKTGRLREAFPKIIQFNPRSLCYRRLASGRCEMRAAGRSDRDQVSLGMISSLCKKYTSRSSVGLVYTLSPP
jgi:hypothetical protein